MDIKSYYEKRYQRDGYSAFKSDPRRLKLLDRLPLGYGKLALDFGCGTGEMCRVLAEKGYYTYGRDISKVAIEKAQARHWKFVPHLSVGDSMDGLPKNNFAVITCFGVLEHVPDVERLLKDFQLSMVHNSTAIFIVANSDSPYFMLTMGTGQVYEKPRSMDEWRGVFEYSGFKIISIDRDPGPSFDPSASPWKNLKILVHRLINAVLPLKYTYQFVFEVRKG